MGVGAGSRHLRRMVRRESPNDGRRGHGRRDRITVASRVGGPRGHDPSAALPDLRQVGRRTPVGQAVRRARRCGRLPPSDRARNAEAGRSHRGGRYPLPRRHRPRPLPRTKPRRPRATPLAPRSAEEGHTRGRGGPTRSASQSRSLPGLRTFAQVAPLDWRLETKQTVATRSPYAHRSDSRARVWSRKKYRI